MESIKEKGGLKKNEELRALSFEQDKFE